MVSAVLLTILGAVCAVKCDVIKIKESDINFSISTKASEEKDWWQTATFYQIYPRSFKDSNNDGKGDLKGIIDKLDYIQSLGVTAIWLSPIFKSPQVDQGYDISDFRDIDPDYGTLEDFINLIKEAHDRSIKVILDFVPNHTSDHHEWFQKSVSREEGFEDYYIWENGTVAEDGSKVPPNNWISVFKNSAWTWNDGRQQYYFHQFLKEQPDLNYRNEKVVKEMKDILTFWLDTHDVDGVRIDAIPHLVEAADLTDEPLSNATGYTEIDYEYLDHIYTKDQPETFDIVYDWRAHLDNITKTKNISTRVIMTEAATDIENVIKYYGSADGTKLGAHFSFNFNLLGLNSESTTADIENDINEWIAKLPSKYTYNWLLGNHDNHRIATKVGTPEKVDGLNMLTSFLPGVEITYNGEEIGMEDGVVTCEEGQDGSATSDCAHYNTTSRDFERTPFQWDDTKNAGFNEGAKPWLPVSPKYTECNVKAQLNEDKSHLKIYIQLQELRSSLRDQDQIEITHPNDNNNLLHISRYSVGDSNAVNDIYDYIFNIGSETVEKVELKNKANQTTFKVVVSSQNSTRNVGDKVDGTSLTVQAYESLILTTGTGAAIKSSYLLLTVLGLLYTLHI